MVRVTRRLNDVLLNIQRREKLLLVKDQREVALRKEYILQVLGGCLEFP